MAHIQAAGQRQAGFSDSQANLADFAGARLGLFIHYGLYSILGRGEWVLNREQIPIDSYKRLAEQFDPVHFDASAIARLARQAGCRYVCLTTMHHDGFALYDSDLNPFNSMRACGRDLVREMVAACRQQGLRVHLYHSLNNWVSQPDAVAALESKADYDRFIAHTFDRLRELVTLFSPIDCLWYDGWWPFSAAGWQAEAMNRMVREIQPAIIFNGRNGLPGDFATPEQHISAPSPWRPWEACFTHNTSWGYHAGDHCYKPNWEIVHMLTQVATGGGNLLLNVGPDGSGKIPQPSVDMLGELGRWIAINSEAIYDSEPFTFDYQSPGDHRGDWSSLGRYTARGCTLYLHLTKWLAGEVCIAGLRDVKAKVARLLGSDAPLPCQQRGGRLIVQGLPDKPPHALGGVVAIDFDAPPRLYLCGGMRAPRVDHPRYDPCPSDLPPW